MLKNIKKIAYKTDNEFKEYLKEKSPDDILYVISFYEDDNKDWNYETEKEALEQAVKLIQQKEPIQLTEVNYTKGIQRIILSYGFYKKGGKQGDVKRP